LEVDKHIYQIPDFSNKSTPSKKMPSCHCERSRERLRRRSEAIPTFAIASLRDAVRVRNDRFWIIYFVEHSKSGIWVS